MRKPVLPTLPRPQCEQRNICRLTATIRGVPYGVTPVHAEASDVIKAWKLRKRDGTEYVVADTIDGATCECTTSPSGTTAGTGSAASTSRR